MRVRDQRLAEPGGPRTSPNNAMAAPAYDAAAQLEGGVLLKLTLTATGQHWEPRFVALTATHLLVFKTAQTPVQGARARSSMLNSSGSDFISQ